MSRQCSRTGCAELAVITLSYQYARSIVWLDDLYAERDPLYRECSHFVIETGRPSVTTLVNMILMQLELAGIVEPNLVHSPVDPLRGPEAE